MCIYIFILGVSRGTIIPCVTWLERLQVHLDVLLRRFAKRRFVRVIQNGTLDIRIRYM